MLHISDKETTALFGAISMEDVKQAMSAAETVRIADTDNKEILYSTASGIVAGELLGRLETLEKDESYRLLPCEEAAEYTFTRKSMDGGKPEDATDFVYSLIWQAFRYGYYKALADRE